MQTAVTAEIQGFAEPLHHAESVKRKALHITYITIHTMYIDKHTTLDALHFQHDAKILQNPVVPSITCIHIIHISQTRNSFALLSIMKLI